MSEKFSGNLPKGVKTHGAVDGHKDKTSIDVSPAGMANHHGDLGSIFKEKLKEGGDIAVNSLDKILLNPMRKRQIKWTQRYYEVVGRIEKSLSRHVEGGSPNNYSSSFHSQDPGGGDEEDENFENRVATQNCQKFSYRTLYDATNEFSSQNMLGQGGFGLVYKGMLDDGREIAVKKSSRMSKEHRKTLIREVDLLSRVKHPNVVKLLGYCTKDDQFLLVYEYVPNKSLDILLFGPNGREPKLDWTRTHDIIVGIAKGLSYLHSDSQNCIIHRDIKAGNILLHHNWVPKISDFGISRLFDTNQTHASTVAVGTWGYIAPEYIDHGYVSVKIDVYSFGVLVLELISGHRYSFKPPPEDNAMGLLNWAYKLFKEGRISDIMDHALADSAIIEQVEKCIEIGLRCTQGDPKLRPNMEHVVFMLTANHSHEEISILEPGIFGYRGYHVSRLSKSAEEIQCSSYKEALESSETFDIPTNEDQSRNSSSNTY